MKLNCKISIGLVGCRQEFPVEIDDEDLEDLTPPQRDKYIEDAVVEEMWRQQIVFS